MLNFILNFYAVMGEKAEFKKHDRVVFTFGGEKVLGYVQKKQWGLYLIIDDAGKEWFMNEDEIKKVAHQFSFK